ncbi:MAG: hypothetical protein P4L69_24625 [Desulfosporosinus sp.]|nr:hypothetical protein [Desulfosporosinus sp.]
MEYIRYWFKNITEFLFDNDGYLIDPESYYSEIYKNKAIMLESIVEKHEKSCVFFGDSGIGKSTEFCRLTDVCRKKSEKVFCYNFENYNEYYSFTKKDIDKIMSSGNKGLTYIVIDSIDERIENAEKMFDILIDLYSNVVNENLRLLLSCSTIYWSEKWASI